MASKKLQVFVSSTYSDLIVERQAAVQAILTAGHIPAGMELFSAGDESQMTVIQRWIDESDVYLLIVGGRYGSVDRKTDKSYTQLEYEYALSRNMAMFSLVIHDSTLEDRVRTIGSHVKESDYGLKLKEFKHAVTSDRLVKFWHDEKDIQIAIYNTLAEFSQRANLVGWVRGTDQTDSNALIAEIARLAKANDELRGQISKGFTSSSQLFDGLSFDELAMILKKVEIKDNLKNEMNSYDAFLRYGTELIGHVDPQSFTASRLINVLRRYSLASRDNITGQFYTLTPTGRNFLNRALFIKQIDES